MSTPVIPGPEYAALTEAEVLAAVRDRDAVSARFHITHGIRRRARKTVGDSDLRGMGLFSLVYHSWGERHETDH
jgi:hypothetical protein